MNAQTQTLLAGLAKEAGLTLEFAGAQAVRVVGYQSGEVHCITLPQPDSELIFAILHGIGRVAVEKSCRPALRYPWFLNRSYEWQFAGEVAYLSRRIMKQKLNSKWSADLWALCAFAVLPCKAEFKEYLSRHPEMLRIMPLVCYAHLKRRFQIFLGKSFRVLFPKWD